MNFSVKVRTPFQYKEKQKSSKWYYIHNWNATTTKTIIYIRRHSKCLLTALRKWRRFFLALVCQGNSLYVIYSTTTVPGCHLDHASPIFTWAQVRWIFSSRKKNLKNHANPIFFPIAPATLLRGFCRRFPEPLHTWQVKCARRGNPDPGEMMRIWKGI